MWATEVDGQKWEEERAMAQGDREEEGAGKNDEEKGKDTRHDDTTLYQRTQSVIWWAAEVEVQDRKEAEGGDGTGG